MAIVAYTGLPGSGKSYGVVENTILPALRDNRRVWTNIPMHQEALDRDLPGCQLTQFSNEDMTKPGFFKDLPGGVVVVIDECWRLWPSGLKANVALEEHKSFLAEHRHRVGDDGYSMEIILVTQDLSQIAAWARSLVDTTFRSVKMQALGANKKYRIDIYTGPVTGTSPPVSKQLRQIFGSYKPDVYQYYQSHTQGNGAVGHEKKADRRANALGSTLIKIGMPLSALVVVYAVWSFYSYMANAGDNPNLSPNKGRQEEAPLPSIIPAPVAESRLAAPRVILSPDWRITGQVKAGPAYHYVLMESNQGGARRVSMKSGVCTYGDHIELTCEIDGERITRHTGRVRLEALGIPHLASAP